MKIQYRYLTCFTIWFNLVMFYLLRSNVSVGILNMVKRDQSGNLTSNKAPCNNGKYPDQEKISGPFEWDDYEQGLVLSSFFIGYFMSHFAGSILTEKIGIRITHAISIAGSSFFTFMMVPMAYAGTGTFIFARFLVGFFSGPLYPMIHVMMGHWAPVEERTILTVLTHSGNILGLVLTFGPGAIINNSGQKGWEYLYYFSGALGLLNLILWLIFGYDYPEEHPFISTEEKHLINKSLYGNIEKPKKKPIKNIPLSHIFSSPQVYIQLMAQTANCFIIYAYLTGHPKFLSDVYGVPADLASYYSMISFISNFAVQVSVSFLTDYIKSKRIISITTLRRILSGIGFIGGVTFMLPVGFVGCSNMSLVITLLSISFGLHSLNQCGFFTSMVDLAPQYAGIMMGISNTIGSLAGIAQPQMVGKLLEDQGYLLGWRNAFIITGLVSLALAAPYIVFGSSAKQYWADGKDKIKESKKSKQEETK